ncbi:MAG TPA: hypothetical protein EYP71_02130 [Dehalococcoidia bacterium]|nr:hypothetical protein [Dehalococcoidia bacterium]
MKITLKPISSIDSNVLEELRRRLAQAFGCSVKIMPGIDSLDQSYDSRRGQYLAAALLAKLKALGVAKDEKVLGLVDVDLYAPGLNFVFGQADPAAGIAIVSLRRLRQEFYGLPPDAPLFLDRATKEAVHELGHTWSLGHCPNVKCVMHFSNSLADTDRKQATFCSQCCPKLIK